MRVIAGTARGTKLKALAGEEITRPTIDRVKEGMFSSLQFVLPGAKGWTCMREADSLALKP